MESASLLTVLLSTQTPALPAPWLARAYLMLGWGLVLAALGIWALQRRGVAEGRIRTWLPALLLLWCLWPGPLSPAYWLGLAFRAPSLLLVLLGGWILWRHYRPQTPALPVDALRRHAWVPVVLGWALLLDTFALWPVSLYGLGFAPLTLGVLLLLALLPWLLRGAGAWVLPLVAVLVLYVLLRLPSGNVWDALLDPWLWILLQLDGLRRRLRRV